MSCIQDSDLAAAAARLGAWKSLCARLRSAAAAKLPDLLALMSVHAQLRPPGVAQVLLCFSMQSIQFSFKAQQCLHILLAPFCLLVKSDVNL